MRHLFTNLRQGLRRNLSMHVAVILTLFVSLSLAGVGVLLYKQAQITTDQIGSELTLNVYLCVPDDLDFPQCTSEVTPEQEAVITTAIEENPEVAGVEEISKEEGLEALIELGEVTREQTQGDDALITAANLPKVLRVTLEEANQYDGVVSAVQSLDGVQSIVLAEDLVGPVFGTIESMQWVAFGGALVLVVAAVLLVANTIRLTALARRKEIEIMRLVGASRFFIAMPFLLEAIFDAVVGVLLAGGALAAMMKFGIRDELTDRVQSLLFVDWPEFWQTAIIVAVLGPLMTVLPTLLLTRKYLRI